MCIQDKNAMWSKENNKLTAEKTIIDRAENVVKITVDNNNR